MLNTHAPQNIPHNTCWNSSHTLLSGSPHTGRYYSPRKTLDRPRESPYPVGRHHSSYIFSRSPTGYRCRTSIRQRYLYRSLYLHRSSLHSSHTCARQALYIHGIWLRTFLYQTIVPIRYYNFTSYRCVKLMGFRPPCLYYPSNGIQRTISDQPG